ncbi:MAG: hypothetical protein QOE46_637 [Acidobacteriota bacterium]|jgi:hypothetical protein|nr:hypothetical protein [Acidobacteriota bacterium]
MNTLNIFPNTLLHLRRAAPFLFGLCVFVSFSARSTPAQGRREHLTPEEIELVRDNQALDARTGVFIKAAERRMLAITNPEEAARAAAKDKEKWGELKGTHEQFFYDIGKILDEAVTNIDDSATHNPDSPLLRKSLYMLSQATAQLVPELTKLRAGVQSESEADQLDRALETAQEVSDAAKDRGVGAEDLKVKPAKKVN